MQATFDSPSFGGERFHHFTQVTYLPQIEILKEVTCLYSFRNKYKSDTLPSSILEERGLKMVLSCDLLGGFLPVNETDPSHRLLVLHHPNLWGLLIQESFCSL